MRHPLFSRILACALIAVLICSLTPALASALQEGQTGTDALPALSAAVDNTAPVAEDLDLTTYRNVALIGRFQAVDPEGDLLTFHLVKNPARGSVALAEDGSNRFVYTPYENKTGRDTFSYVAVDALGNTSQTATVTVRILKAKTKVTYSDMTDSPAHVSAIRLAEEGLLVGSRMGNAYFFEPELPITRSAFIAMAMDCAGLEPLRDVSLTGFADDAAIPVWAKGYASSGLKAGVILGSSDESGQIVFRPGADITRAEAAVLLDRLLRVSDVADAGAWLSDSAVPVWASQSVADLVSCGMMELGDTEAVLTRAEAAELLCGALDLVESRQSGWLSR